MNKKIVVIYKQPGQSPGYMRIKNSDEEFKKVLGGEIEKLDLGALEENKTIIMNY